MNGGSYRFTIALIFLTFFHLSSSSRTMVTNDHYARFRHLTIEDGLPGNNINYIFQDRDRYVWIGTDRGLSRYDGNFFKNFFADKNDSSSLPDNFVVCIRQDSAGNIWTATKNGLAYYDHTKEQFVRIPLISEKGKGLTGNRIRCIMPDKYPFIWVETEDGNLQYLNSETYESKIYPHNRITQPYYNYHSIIKDSYDNLWIGGRNLGPVFFSPQTKNFTYIPVNPKDPKKKRDNDVACYFEDSKNRFWISGTDGFYQYDRINDIFTKKLATSTFQIAEDNENNLWLATGGGLYKYIPEKELFIRFSHNESDPYSISANHQYCIMIDADGNIWTGTANGINILLKDQTFIKHYRHIPSVDHSLNNNKVTSFYEMNDSVIYIGTAGGGLNVLNTKNERFRAYTTDSHSNCPITADQVSVIKGNRDTLWIGLWRGVGFNRYDTHKNCFTRYAVSPNTFKIDWYNDFYDNGSDTLWCGIWGGNGIHLFNKRTGKFLLKNFYPAYHPDNSPLYKQFINENFLITINNRGIIYLFDTITDSFNGYISNTYKNTAEIFKLKTADIPTGIKKIYDGLTIERTTLLLTNKGLIFFSAIDTTFHQTGNTNYPCYAVSKSNDQHCFWTGTKKGLEYYDHNKKISLVIEKNNSKDSPLYNRRITSLYLNEKGKLLVGTNKGLLVYDPIISEFISPPVTNKPILENSHIKKIGQIQGNRLYFILDQGFAVTTSGFDTVRVYNVSNSFKMRMPTDIIYDITQSPDNNELLLATNIGIIRFSYESKSFSIINKLNKYTIHSLGHLGDKLSVCTDKGYLQYIPGTDSVIHYNYPPPDRLSSHLISFLHEDNDGFVWAGTTNRGVNKIDPKSGLIHQYFEAKNKTFAGKDALCFLQTWSGQIFVGGEKLNLYDPDNDRFTEPEFAKMIPDEPVLALLEDNDKNLWIITENNILKYNFSDNSLTNFKELLGSTNITFTGGVLKQRSGRFLTGTKQGFLQFDPHEIKYLIPSIPVHISGITVFGKPVTHDKKIKGGIELNYDENFLKINFSSMNYSPVETTCEYKLEGIDKHWVKTTSPSTSYTKIQPGNYLFKVRNADLPDSTLTSFRIIIKPPFWKTWWFMSLLILALISLVFYWWKLRLNKLKVLENNLKLKQRLLLSQLNPHFIFNILTAIQNYIYQNDPQASGKYLSRFAKLMRLVLENMRSESTTVDNEVTTLSYYLEMQKLRFNNSFEFKINTEGVTEGINAALPTMMIQPLIENAVEHGMRGVKEGGLITVDIKLQSDRWEVIIEDNGIGFNKKEQNKSQKKEKHKSISTKIIKERLDGFNKKTKKRLFGIKYMTPETGRGTKIILALPVLEIEENKTKQKEEQL